MNFRLLWSRTLSKFCSVLLLLLLFVVCCCCCCCYYYYCFLFCFYKLLLLLLLFCVSLIIAFFLSFLHPDIPRAPATPLPPPVVVNNTEIKTVEKSCYHGISLGNSGSLDGEMTQRIAQASSAFGRLTQSLWQER